MACSNLSGQMLGLLAMGSINTVLHDDPTSGGKSAFVTQEHSKTTQYQLGWEEMQVPSARLGGRCEVEIQKNYDLILKAYVRTSLPGVKGTENPNATNCFKVVADPCDPADESALQLGGLPPLAVGECDLDLVAGCPAQIQNCVWASWCNNVGTRLIEEFCMFVGGSPIGESFHDFENIWEELTGKPGKRLAEMTGKRQTWDMVMYESSYPREIYTPLALWFTRAHTAALRTVALQFHVVKIAWVNANAKDLVLRGSATTSVSFVTQDDNGVRSISAPATNNADVPFTQHLLLNGALLDSEERTLVATGKAGHHTIPYLSVKRIASNLQAGTKGSLDASELNNASNGVYWFVRREAMINANDWYNYSGVKQQDPLRKTSFSLNSHPHFELMSQVSRMVVPHAFYCNIPESFIYAHNFGTDPGHCEHRGSLNLSKIENIKFTWDTAYGLGRDQDDKYEVVVFNHYWNLATYGQGMMGKIFV